MMILQAQMSLLKLREAEQFPNSCTYSRWQGFGVSQCPCQHKPYQDLDILSGRQDRHT